MKTIHLSTRIRKYGEVCRGDFGCWGKRQLCSLIVLSAMLTASPGWSAESVPATQPTQTGLHPVDWLAIATYAVAVLTIGWIASRRKESTRDYFIGGKGIGSFIIGISMFVTLFSTNSYLANPGEMIKHGPAAALGGILALPIVFVLISYVYIPTLIRRKVVSAYELLEDQLGVSVRLLGAVMYIFVRTFWMSTMIYFASVALVTILGLDPAYGPAVAIFTGLIAITYTSMGGLRAVLLTDNLQFFVLFIGTFAAMVVTTIHYNGFAWIPTEWKPNWDTQPFWTWDFSVRATILGAMIGTLTIHSAQALADQTMVQRYMASKDLKAARKAVVIKLIAGLVVSIAIMGMGIAVLAFYEMYPDSIPSGETIDTFADRLFPHFIANELPMGLAGLVVAALFAAAMSSVDSGVNAITAVVMNDFLTRFDRLPTNAEKQRLLAKCLAFGVGAAVVCLSLLVIPHVPGNFLEIVARSTHIALPLLFGIFFTVYFVKFATAFGVYLGVIYGFTLGIIIAYWAKITGGIGISFQLYAFCIVLIQIGLGTLFSLLPVKTKHVLWGQLCVLPLVLYVIYLSQAH